jgi:hypothetical protein
LRRRAAEVVVPELIEAVRVFRIVSAHSMLEKQKHFY